MTSLQLLGNACTVIIAPDGTRVVSDPYGKNRPPGLSPLPADLTADVVTVSHVHPDHNNVSAVGGSPRIITEPGVYEAGMIGIRGYGSREGSPSGWSDLRNVIFVFEIGGAKIVHLGDAGLIPEAGIRKAITNADVILVNIDGFVLPLGKLITEMEKLKARTIVPTHFSVSPERRWATDETFTLDEYLATIPKGIAVKRMERGQMEVGPDMPRQIVGLPYLLA